jgi:hypothetical protein
VIPITGELLGRCADPPLLPRVGQVGHRLENDVEVERRPCPIRIGDRGLRIPEQGSDLEEGELMILSQV